MKILRDAMVKPWWLGQQVDCQMCGCIFELEFKDRPTREYRHGREVVFECPKCPNTLLLMQKTQDKETKVEVRPAQPQPFAPVSDAT